MTARLARYGTVTDFAPDWVRKSRTRSVIRTVVLPEGPFQRRWLVPDDEAAAVGIEIGLVRNDPEIHVHRGKVCVDVYALEPAVIFETPPAQQWICADD